MKEIYIVGVGSYSEVMYELAKDCGYAVKGFYDVCENGAVRSVMAVGSPARVIKEREPIK